MTSNVVPSSVTTEVDASKRYTAEQALAHPWVTGQQTPNKYLRSPNYLATIKKERMARTSGRKNGPPPSSGHGGAATNGGAGNYGDASQDHSSRIHSRRQSH